MILFFYVINMVSITLAVNFLAILVETISFIQDGRILLWFSLLKQVKCVSTVVSCQNNTLSKQVPYLWFVSLCLLIKSFLFFYFFKNPHASKALVGNVIQIQFLDSKDPTFLNRPPTIEEYFAEIWSHNTISLDTDINATRVLKFLYLKSCLSVTRFQGVTNVP